MYIAKQGVGWFRTHEMPTNLADLLDEAKDKKFQLVAATTSKSTTTALHLAARVRSCVGERV